MTAHSGRGRLGTWRLAPSLVDLEAEANAIAPHRSRASDGSVGDADHQSRDSDHNPKPGIPDDWVDALDLDHDPAGGFDAHAYARQVAADPAQRERLKFVISNAQIFSRKLLVWKWRKYKGANSHKGHAHFSVTPKGRFIRIPWLRRSAAPPPATPPPGPAPADMLKLFRVIGARDVLPAARHIPNLDGNSAPSLHIVVLQKALNIVRLASIPEDGHYSELTIMHVVAFQNDVEKMFGDVIKDFPGACHETTRFFICAALTNISNGIV